MSHPQIAGYDWTLDSLVYDDGVEGIAVAMFSRHNGTESALGFRWMFNGKVTYSGGFEWRSPYFGKSSEWVLLPYAFAVPVAKELMVKHSAGMRTLNEEGFKKMVAMLVAEEDVIPGMGY